MNKTEVKYQLIKFLIVTFVLSFALQFYVIFNGGIQNFSTAILIGLMWIPGLVSLIFRVIQKDWNDVGLKLGNKKYFIIAFFIPCIGAFLSTFVCYLLDIRIMKLVESVSLLKIALQFSIIFVIGFFSALGEELGWRGYLVPKIYRTNIKYPTLLTGIIWALWHIPIVAFSGYYQTLTPFLVIILYSSVILGLNYFINWIRLSSGSMWTATLTHASYNFFFQTFWLHILFKSPGRKVEFWEKFGGDVGLIPILIFFIVFLIGRFKLNWKLQEKTSPNITQNH